MLQVRNAVFTLNNPDGTFSFENHPEVRGAIWQLERGEQGTEHYQGYIEFTKKMSFKAIKGVIGDRAHIEERMGTREQAIEYCRKDDTRVDGPWIYGDMDVNKAGKQGKRTDLDDACDKIISNGRNIGKGLYEVASEHPSTFVKFHKGLQALATRLNMGDRDVKPNVEWIYGPTGCGKTLYASKKTSTFYIKDGTMWWDGYEQQETIIIDDFDGKWPFRDLLRILDRYPYQGQYKGGYVKINSPNIIITCDKRPEVLYADILSDDELSQLLRRLDAVGRPPAADVV